MSEEIEKMNKQEGKPKKTLPTQEENIEEKNEANEAKLKAKLARKKAAQEKLEEVDNSTTTTQVGIRKKGKIIEEENINTKTEKGGPEKTLSRYEIETRLDEARKKLDGLEGSPEEYIATRDEMDNLFDALIEIEEAERGLQENINKEPEIKDGGEDLIPFPRNKPELPEQKTENENYIKPFEPIKIDSEPKIDIEEDYNYEPEEKVSDDFEEDYNLEPLLHDEEEDIPPPITVTPRTNRRDNTRRRERARNEPEAAQPPVVSYFLEEWRKTPRTNAALFNRFWKVPLAAVKSVVGIGSLPERIKEGPWLQKKIKKWTDRIDKWEKWRNKPKRPWF